MGSFVGSPSDIGAILGRPSQAVNNYIQERVTQYVQKAGEVGVAIASTVQNQYNQFVESTASVRAAAVRNMFNSYWQTDSIRQLTEPGSLQTAPPTMVRWIMTEPRLRDLYHQGRVAGYEDAYIDRDKDLVGNAQYDYRRLYNGVVKPTDTGYDYSEYHEPLMADDYVLTCVDKAVITATHKVINDCLDEDVDPTSIWNDSVK